MNRIDAKFKELKAQGNKALIVYLTCGYPDIATTERLVVELEKRGVDIIELGIPFSDPLADGPIIQEALQDALKKKINLKDIFLLVKRIREKSQIPICLMGYYNPIFSLGQVNFVNQAIKAGVDGVIIPDLPPEEDLWLVSLAQKANLKIIFFLSPTSLPPHPKSPALQSGDEGGDKISSTEKAPFFRTGCGGLLTRVKYISRVSTGFIYYVSLTGVTGARQNLSVDLTANIKLIKKYTEKPVCVGFGISKAQHIKEVCKVADGAIIGSAVIKVIKENIGKKDLVKKVGRFVEGLLLCR